MRSRSELIRMPVTMMRRSVATGFCRARRSIASASISSRMRSMALSPAMTVSASWMSASSRAVVARDMAEPTSRVISTSWSEILSRSSWNAWRICDSQSLLLAGAT